MKLHLTCWVPIALALGAAPVSAAEITLAGYANGCFFTPASHDPSCSPVVEYDSRARRTQELFYFNGSFAGTTSGGQLPVSLGEFSLLPRGNDDYAGRYFNLRVTFDTPDGYSANTVIVPSVMTGRTSSAPGQCKPSAAPCGSVTVDFDNTPVPFTFTNGNNTGSFLLTILDLTIAGGQTDVALSGLITAAGLADPPTSTVPEPGTLTLLGVGMSGLIARRRFRGGSVAQRG